MLEVVKALYFEGLTTSSTWVEAAIKESATYNVVKRVSDVAPWFIQEAAARYRLHYITPYKKTERKESLIKGLQDALSSGKLFIDVACTAFADEIINCQWSESVEGKIINSQSYHLLDSGMYGIDELPKWKGPSQVSGDYHVNLRMQCNEYREKKAKKQKQVQATARIKRARRGRGRQVNRGRSLPLGV